MPGMHSQGLCVASRTPVRVASLPVASWMRSPDPPAHGLLMLAAPSSLGR